jgi:BirA family biotin operon repressor/biotin-[acetyl-CoA-carboxylase] ligase
LTAAGVTHLAEVGSTNDWLLGRAGDIPDGHWVHADRQTAGRGRRGRAWSDGAGNLMASMLVRATGPVQQLSFVAALALRETLLIASSALSQFVTPAKARGHLPNVPAGDDAQAMGPRLRGGDDSSQRLTLKWPNDLLLDGAKVSGILLERAGDALVIGFGANLATHPDTAERPATSLAAAGWPVPAPADALAALMPAFAAWRDRWVSQGFEPVRAAWLEHAAGLGASLVARLGSETIEGRFDGLDSDGALRLRLDDGTVRAIHAGEVFAL